ncbi:MAG: hydroxymethylbilane synthase, partial [Saprospiraceae bacterium]|nr:hydroxymethylbilane synthase [Saprospiraceae bacterium]
MKPKKIIVGTRGSKLALWQANFVRDQLESLGVEVEIKIVQTKGDAVTDLSFDKIEGKGFFTKEIEEELLAGKIDMAVHSMKDLPTESPEGLVIAGVSYRADPADWLIIRESAVVENQSLNLKSGAIVGTSSNRRKSWIKDFRLDVVLKNLRGNVPTRLNKLRSGDYDAIILAAAGITRLELSMDGFFVQPLNVKEFVPAPAQGVLAFQVRNNDLSLRRFIQENIHHSEVSSATNVERTLLKLFNGGCQLALGAYCELDSMGNYHLWASYSENPGDSVR